MYAIVGDVDCRNGEINGSNDVFAAGNGVMGGAIGEVNGVFAAGNGVVGGAMGEVNGRVGDPRV